MKKLLLFFVMVAAIFALQSQTVIFQDNFDSYTAGTPLTVQNSTNWTTWSGGTGGVEDPMVSTEQAQTNPNSIKFTGDNDIIYKFSNQTTGTYKVEFDYYVPSSGMGGYFNVQHYANPGVEWAVEIYFGTSGNGQILAGSATSTIPFSFPNNQWFHIIFDVNLDIDEAKLTINNVLAHTWPFSYKSDSQTGGICQLGGMNFYAGYLGGSGGGGTYFLDNFKFSQIMDWIILYQDNFDEYTAGQSLCTQNSTDWSTWTGGTGNAEDPMVSSAQNFTVPNSVNMTAENDIIYKFQNQTTGEYRVEMKYFIPTGSNGGYFNIQHYFNPGTMWAFECYFSGVGTGELKAGGTTTPFTMPANAWFDIQVDINMDEDLCTLFINGNSIRTWPFSYQANSQTGGINQLGSVNIYAGYLGGTGGGGNYFLDNFKVSTKGAPNPAQFIINPESNIDMTVYTVGNKTINLSNPGGAALDYEVVAIYDIPNPNPASTGETKISWAGTPSGSGIGFTNTSLYTVATGFTPEMLKNHIGKSVRKYTVSLSNTYNIITAKLCVWKMGPMGTPSLDPPVYEQNITVSSLFDGDNVINFQQPYIIDGSYLYVGLIMTTVPGDNTTFVSIGTDNTPDNQCNKLGRLYRSTVAWTSVSGLAGYWVMSIDVDGTPIKPWMTLDHITATLQPSSNKDLKVTFGASDITDNCIKNGHLYFYSTDFHKEETIIDVKINFIIGEVPVLVVTPTSIEETITEGDNPIKTVPVTITNNGTVEGEYEAAASCPAGWLTITGDIEGKVPAGGSKSFNAVINAGGLEIGDYQAAILITTNDPQNQLFEIVCKLSKLQDIEIFTLSQSQVFPNPASDRITVKCNKEFNTIQIINISGQIVYSATVNGDQTTIDTSNLSAGNYFIRVITNEGAHSVKLIIK